MTTTTEPDRRAARIKELMDFFDRFGWKMEAVKNGTVFTVGGRKRKQFGVYVGHDLVEALEAAHADLKDVNPDPPRQPNPPIKGHKLLMEGLMLSRGNGEWSGGCECGEKPNVTGGWGLGTNQVKRWHRDIHKPEIRRLMAEAKT